jgi:hypothetical protein
LIVQDYQPVCGGDVLIQPAYSASVENDDSPGSLSRAKRQPRGRIIVEMHHNDVLVMA